MNTAGQVASLLCPLIVAYSVQRFGNWDLPLQLLALLFLLGAGSWLMIDPHRADLRWRAPAERLTVAVGRARW